jgi:sugar lactone lactonase YvrE
MQMPRRSGWLVVLVLGLLALAAPPAGATPRAGHPTAHRLVAGLEGGSGSTIGPDGALYVTESAAGRVTRVDPRTGATTTFASGLPRLIPEVGFGGPVDVAFLGRTAYVLVTLVGPDVGGSDVVGLYRVDGPDRFTVIADIGQFSIDNPPETDFFVPSGVQYGLQAYRGGLLVTDGHHNRVLRVARNGQIRELRAFSNIVPTGLDVRGGTIYMAEAGPVPHVPEDGRVVAFRPTSPTVREVAAGARLLVDVELGHGGRLYALSQGVFPTGAPEGSPALPNTGALVKANRDGTLTVVVDGLNQPTSLELIGETGYVITLGGEIWKINGV